MKFLAPAGQLCIRTPLIKLCIGPVYPKYWLDLQKKASISDRILHRLLLITFFSSPIGTPLFFALIRGDIKSMFQYADHPEEEEKDTKKDD